MLICHKGHTDTIQVYSVTVMTHVKALQAGHSSQGTSEPGSEPITPELRSMFCRTASLLQLPADRPAWGCYSACGWMANQWVNYLILAWHESLLDESRVGGGVARDVAMLGERITDVYSGHI